MNDIIQFLIDHKEAIIAALAIIYELIARRKPTEKDYTIVGFVYSVLDIIAKNRRKISDDDEVVTKIGESEKNLVAVDRTKIIK